MIKLLITNSLRLPGADYFCFKTKLLTTIVLILCPFFAKSQARLILYKLGSEKHYIFEVNDEIRFKIKGADYFNRTIILQFTDSSFFSEQYEVRLNEIEAVDISDKKIGGSLATVGQFLIYAGALYAIGDVVNNELVQNNEDTSYGKTAAIGGGLIVGGLLLKWPSQNVFKIKNRKRIRIINY